MNKDDSYWLKVSYVIFAAIVGFTAWKATGTIGVQTGWADRYDDWYPLAASIFTVLVAVGATAYLVSNKQRTEYFLAAIGEVRKVSFPSAVDTRRMTTVVCIVVGIFAVILSIFDFIWAKIFALII
jgi:preprotein translocase SecE subunit